MLRRDQLALALGGVLSFCRDPMGGTVDTAFNKHLYTASIIAIAQS